MDLVRQDELEQMEHIMDVHLRTLKGTNYANIDACADALETSQALLTVISSYRSRLRKLMQQRGGNAKASGH